MNNEENKRVRAFSVWDEDERVGLIYKYRLNGYLIYEIQLKGEDKTTFNSFAELKARLRGYELIPLCR